jgi:hypothetical protein
VAVVEVGLDMEAVVKVVRVRVYVMEVVEAVALLEVVLERPTPDIVS